MKTFLKKLDLIGIEIGYANGYVIIPKGHPIHGKNYDDIDVIVHGGLTFSEEILDLMSWKQWEDIKESDIGGWIVGFDTAHAGDDLETCPKEYVLSEVELLKSQLIELGKTIMKTKEEIEEEIKKTK